MIELTDQDLVLRLPKSEDHFVERKGQKDHGGWLRTVVAFANSAPIGYPAVLFIGVNNDGTIQSIGDLESLQKEFNGVIGRVYPPVACFPKSLESDRKQFLAVIVPGSTERPHFAGQSYIREGSETKAASKDQFDRLIAERSSKAYEILKWRGKSITVLDKGPGTTGSRVIGQGCTIEDCNQFFVKVKIGETLTAYPLYRVHISFDCKHDCLALELPQF